MAKEKEVVRIKWSQAGNQVGAQASSQEQHQRQHDPTTARSFRRGRELIARHGFL